MEIMLDMEMVLSIEVVFRGTEILCFLTMGPGDRMVVPAQVINQSLTLHSTLC